MRTVTQLGSSSPAPPPPTGGRPPAPEASAAPFAAVLDNHQARTAVAEGHTPKRPTGAQDQAGTAPDAGSATADAVPAKPDAVADDTKSGATPGPSLPVTIDTAVVSTVPVAVPVAPVPLSCATPAPPPGTTASAEPPAVAPSPLAAPAFPVAPVPPVGAITTAPGATATSVAAHPPASATTDMSAATVPVPADAGAQASASAPDAATTAALAATGQAGTGTDCGTGTGTGDGRHQATEGDPAAAKRTAAPTAASVLRAVVPAAAPGADAGIATAAGATTPAPTTTAAATSAAPAAPVASSTVSLQQAVETVRLTIGASAQRGVTRARIALRPEELGGVEVHLRHTAEGLSARVVAEAPEAARLLSQAAGELRRTLEQQGLNLVRIEVGTAGSDAAGTGTGAAGSDQRNGRRAPSGQAGDPAGAETDLPIADRTIELPNGVLVDVLA